MNITKTDGTVFVLMTEEEAVRLRNFAEYSSRSFMDWQDAGIVLQHPDRVGLLEMRKLAEALENLA